MNFEDGFKSLGRDRSERPSAAEDSQADAEDVLFAAPTKSEEVHRNPYGEDDGADGFDDFSMGQVGGVGPQAFGDSFEVAGAADAPTLGDPLSEAESVGDGSRDDDMAGSGEMPGLMLGYGEVAPSPSQPPLETFQAGFAPIESERVGSSPSDPFAVGGLADQARAPRKSESGRIPGRSDRVSYSQGKTQKHYRPAPDRLSSRAEARKSLVWVLPFAAFLSVACLSAYYFLRVGSPVLAGVSFVVGTLAGLFSRVLIRR